MHPYEFERGLKMGDNYTFGYDSYERFKAYQMFNLADADKGDLRFYEMLMKRIDNIQLSDKESMVSLQADGFLFNNKGELVITNAR